MKVCIVGAGAIGGYIGARLAAAGLDTSALARGATLQSLRQHGWRLVDRSGSPLAAGPVKASDDPADLGPQDLIVVAVKGPSLASVAAAVGHLAGPATVVLPAMNGVPWWFCARNGGGSPSVIQSVDPGGGIAAHIPYSSVLGCVVHISALTLQPGKVGHQNGNRLIIGEPGTGFSARSEAVVSMLRAAGLEVDHSPDVRRDIWFKLWGNLTMNPVSALTGATVDRILADPLVRGFCSAAMAEASAVGSRIGCPIDQTPEERHAVTARLGAFKTSMLQDVEAGRAIELDSIVSAVQEIARGLGIATPSIDALLGLTRLMARTRGLYPPDAPAAP